MLRQLQVKVCRHKAALCYSRYVTSVTAIQFSPLHVATLIAIVDSVSLSIACLVPEALPSSDAQCWDVPC